MKHCRSCGRPAIPNQLIHFCLSPTVYIVKVTGTEFLNANDRIHWSKRAKLTEQWRTNAGWAVRAARVPRIHGKAHITAVILFPDRRRRDPANWAPTAKACIDGITDRYVKPLPDKDFAHVIRGIIADDDASHVDGPDLRSRVEPGIRVPTLELHITDCGAEL
jgi:hypothetical protein